MQENGKCEPRSTVLVLNVLSAIEIYTRCYLCSLCAEGCCGGVG